MFLLPWILSAWANFLNIFMSIPPSALLLISLGWVSGVSALIPGFQLRTPFPCARIPVASFPYDVVVLSMHLLILVSGQVGCWLPWAFPFLSESSPTGAWGDPMLWSWQWEWHRLRLTFKHLIPDTVFDIIHFLYQPCLVTWIIAVASPRVHYHTSLFPVHWASETM